MELPSDPSDARARRRALVALALVAPAPSFGAAMAFWVTPGTLGVALYGVGKVLLYGTPLLWHLLVERQRPSPSPPTRGGLGQGLALGLVLGVLVWLAWALVARDWIDPSRALAEARANGFDSKARYLAICAWLCVVNAALEEYVFRWFLYTRCRALVGAPAALPLAAAIFTTHHVIVLRSFFDWPLVLLCAAGVFAAGVVWTWCYLRYRSIWPGYASHVVVDVAVMSVGWQILFGATS